VALFSESSLSQPPSPSFLARIHLHPSLSSPRLSFYGLRSADRLREAQLEGCETHTGDSLAGKHAAEKQWK